VLAEVLPGFLGIPFECELHGSTISAGDDCRLTSSSAARPGLTTRRSMQEARGRVRCNAC